jgi:hypothetical protein
MLTRRNILKMAALAQPLLENAFAWSHDDFWNSKDPAQWSDKETTQILTHSPWAKQASIESQGNQGRMAQPGAMGGGRGMGGGMGGGGMGGGRGTGGGMGQDNGGGWGGDGMQNVHALVRWESALPVAAAEKKSAPAEAAQSYIISVSGLPVRQNNNNANADDDSERTERMSGMIKQYTSLDRKGKVSIEPDRVDFTEEVDGGTWRFSFPRSGNAITAEDKDVTFMTKVGRVSLKAKFVLKEMMYKDQLAL